MNTKKSHEFLRTHPWIVFPWDFSRLPSKDWFLLGEAVSKCDHIAETPLTIETSTRLHAVYLAKGAAATARIEGNTLSDDQVGMAIRGELKMPPSKEYLLQEIEAVLEVYRDEALPERRITPELICELNARVLKGLRLDKDVVPGEIRKYSVGVLSYRGAPHQECRYLLQCLCDMVNSVMPGEEDPRSRLQYGILKAFMAHLYLAWIHPFGDGNGRTARALEYLILTCHSCPKPATLLPTTFYSETRSMYYKILAETSAANNPLAFVSYAIEGFVDGLREQLGELRKQLIDLTWRDYLRESLPYSTKTVNRQHDLILELSELTEAISPGDILTSLSPALASQYLGKKRTFQRDLSKLVELELLKHAAGRLVVNKELMLAFMPDRFCWQNDPQPPSPAPSAPPPGRIP